MGVGAPGGQAGYAFLDADQISDLVRRALATLDAASAKLGWVRLPDEEAARAYDAAAAMLLACARCIALLRDPSLAPLACEIVERIQNTDHQYESFAYAATAGVRGLLAAGLAVDELAYLADHPNPHVRTAIAASFPTDTPARLETLLGLAADEDTDVRTSAKKRLEDIDLPFWTGKFSSDPFAAVSDAEAKKLKRPVETICEAFDQRYWSEQTQKAFLAAAARLPPPLAADALARAEVGGFFRYSFGNEVAAALAALGDTGLRALETIVLSPKVRYGKDMFSQKFAEALPVEEARRVLPALLERASAAPVDHAQRDSLAHCLAVVVGNAWPAEDDPAPVLDAILERPRWNPFDPVGSVLAAALRRSRSPAVVERVEQALCRGFPDKWHEIDSEARAYLEALPKPALEGVARRTLDCGVDSSIAWAIGILLDKLWDRKRDGSRRKLALAFDDDPRARSAMRRSHPEKILPRLRKQLVQGVLDFPTAGQAIVESSKLWGGSFCHARFMWIMARLDGVDEKRALHGDDLAQKRFAAYLGPRAGRVPPTDEEWAAYRRVRDAVTLESDKHVELALEALPYEGAFDPADRAFFDRALEYVRARGGKDERDLALIAAAVIAKKGERGDLPLLDELARLAPKRPDDRDYHAEALDLMQSYMRARFDLPAPVAEAATRPADASGELDWIDS